MPEEHRHGGILVEDELPGEQPVTDAAEGVDVRSCVGFLVPVDQLGLIQRYSSEEGHTPALSRL